MILNFRTIQVNPIMNVIKSIHQTAHRHRFLHRNDEFEDRMRWQRQRVTPLKKIHISLRVCRNRLPIGPRRTVNIRRTRTARDRILHTRRVVCLGVRVNQRQPRHRFAPPVFKAERIRTNLTRADDFLVLGLRHDGINVTGTQGNPTIDVFSLIQPIGLAIELRRIVCLRNTVLHTADRYCLFDGNDELKDRMRWQRHIITSVDQANHLSA